MLDTIRLLVANMDMLRHGILQLSHRYHCYKYVLHSHIWKYGWPRKFYYCRNRNLDTWRWQSYRRVPCSCQHAFLNQTLSVHWWSGSDGFMHILCWIVLSTWDLLRRCCIHVYVPDLLLSNYGFSNVCILRWGAYWFLHGFRASSSKWNIICWVTCSQPYDK